MQKRLIALMLAGTLSATALTGCAYTKEKDEREIDHTDCEEYDIIRNSYIVLEQNQIDVLHKGDMTTLFTDGYYAGGPTPSCKYYFDCGQKTISNANHQTYNKEPESKYYDEKCEDCFGLN